MNRVLKSVYLRASVQEAASCWDYFTRRERGRGGRRKAVHAYDAATVSFIPAAGGCFLVVVPPAPSIPPFLGRVTSLITTSGRRTEGRLRRFARFLDSRTMGGLNSSAAAAAAPDHSASSSAPAMPAGRAWRAL